jgi:hypothetical protein
MVPHEDRPKIEAMVQATHRNMGVNHPAHSALSAYIPGTGIHDGRTSGRKDQHVTAGFYKERKTTGNDNRLATIHIPVPQAGFSPVPQAGRKSNPRRPAVPKRKVDLNSLFLICLIFHF